MIYTVTFNPSLDYIVSVNDFQLGLTNRTDSELILPGGKGINVSTILMNLGIDSTAFGFAAGFTGEEIIREVEAMGIRSDFIKIDSGISRINLKLKNIDGTEINGSVLYTIELGHGLNVAECMAHSAMARKESRGAHQRLDEGCTERDDVNFLKHTLAFRDADGTTRLEYSDVKITTLPPAKRVYGGEADAADKAEAANKKEKANG